MQVVVNVENIQTDDVGNQERHSFAVDGQLYKKKIGYYLRYKEELVETEDTITTLKIQEDMITLIRDGGVRMKQEFKAGDSSPFDYVTPYGKLSFKLVVNEVEIKTDANSGDIKLEYVLKDGNDRLISQNQLIITYEEDLNG
ncbi:DUF1934 domain-containing protein [Selenihalanaerobacter shriftii]|uniref:DUF1934 domain-containing protein n=1 Tax=Selenihalanaerobacter shriftii TaxID=142842 RepID=UPI0013564CCE|nr:DUF1934 domain-containing protein [Selenihalanaerobacter shriftii]